LTKCNDFDEMVWVFLGDAMSDQPQGNHVLDICYVCKTGKLIYRFRQVETAPKVEHLVLGQWYPTFRLIKDVECNHCHVVFSTVDEDLSDEAIFYRQLTPEFLETHTLGLKDQDHTPHECPHCCGKFIKRHYNANSHTHTPEDLERRKHVFNYCASCLSILSVLPARQLVCPPDEKTRRSFAELYIKDFGNTPKRKPKA